MKGFTLPTSNTTTNGSFSNLITQTSANANTIVQAPLIYFLNFAGYGGRYWSGVGNDSSSAYDLGFDSGRVSPSDDLDRYFGFSVRCVALGG